ncbi:2-oxoacid:ferredoxin oxidoreductase subunit beta [Candidatus Collierbacteria bacterium]|nr:2-oxoacid:ferredoxin oxidoreductase subunit beta [Candidatus Collierbacteria bacterium]
MDYNTSHFPTWCPGCGDFGIWASLKAAFAKLSLPTHKLALVYGIGCSGNMSSFLKGYGFHGLHGRAIPAAAGIKMANHTLHVIVIGGDGDLLGEGLNHLVTAARANFHLTVILHNNQVYGLTTGQSSPTSLPGSKGKITPKGVIDLPLNPVSLALISGATNVIRSFAGDIPQLTKDIITSLNHPGFSLIDVLQPCVTFNKLNTYSWFRQRFKRLDSVPVTLSESLAKAEWADDSIYLGQFTKRIRPVFTDQYAFLKQKSLIQADNPRDLTKILESLK